MTKHHPWEDRAEAARVEWLEERAAESVLRCSAAAIREDFTPWPEHPEDGCCDAINCHNALADWLEHAAESADLNRTPYVDQHLALALAVARAYLGESA